MIRPSTLSMLCAMALACGGAPPPAASSPSPGGPAPGALSTPAAPGDGLPPAAPSGDTPPATQVTPPPADKNPFDGASFFSVPEYVAHVESSAKAAPGEAALLRKVKAFPTAFWLSSIRDVPAAGPLLDQAAAQMQRTGKAVVTAFTLYDLPDRDCSALASSGELTSQANGEARYRSEFIDPLAAAFRAHPSQRIVAFLEPDSLANLATNGEMPRCAAAAQAYRRSLAYAIRTLSMPHVSLYVDAAHAGWLGWSNNRSRIARIFSEVLADAGGADKIRGFVTNVSNYDSLHDGDLAKLEPSDPAKGELAYVKILDLALSEVGITGKAFVIDTGRNGRMGLRTKSGSWCNVRGAGLGERPQANPAPLVDAYFWVKPPGESDGGSDPSKPGFDGQCGGPGAPDSAPDAPRAGLWFHHYFVDLAKNADPGL